MDIHYDFYRWGPYVFKSKLPTVEVNKIISFADSPQEINNSNLASNIADTRSLNQDGLKKLEDLLYPWTKTYVETMVKHLELKVIDFNELRITAAWVNFQKRYESNSEHYHTEDISFVVYLKVPPELREENTKYEGTSAGPGGITFRYGEQHKFSRSSMAFFPSVGDIFIFPSYLAHWVVPFNSDCTRVSLAGNIRCVKHQTTDGE